MQIEGRKNLELLKRALMSHMTECCHRSTRCSDKEMKEKWDPEITATNKMLDSVEINLGRYEEVIPEPRIAMVLIGE